MSCVYLLADAAGDQFAQRGVEPAGDLIVDAEAIKQSLSVLLQQFFVANDGPKTMGEAIARRDDPAD